MKLSKIIGIISCIIGILLGIALLVVAIMDIDVPKSVWCIFTVVCLMNAVINIISYKKNAKQ